VCQGPVAALQVGADALLGEVTVQESLAGRGAAAQPALNLTIAATYGGTLPRLVDSVSYQIYLGDAWTDPRQIEVIPLPAVTVELVPHAVRIVRPPRPASEPKS
jgi:hypothetical protein